MKIQTVRAFLSYTPQVILEEHMLGHTINTISDLLQSKFYPHLTGDYNGMIGQMVDEGILSSASLTRRVNLTRITIDSALSSTDLLKVHYDLQKSAVSQQGIPVELLDKIIDL